MEKELKALAEEMNLAHKKAETELTEKLNKIKEDTAKSIEEKAEAIEKTLKEGLELAEKRADELDQLLQKKAKQQESNDFGSVFSKAIETEFEVIKSVSVGRSAKLNLKAVGTMTIANNLTGAGVITYQNTPALAPMPFINFRDLVPTVNSATGIYSLYRGSGTEGSISSQSTPGNAKTQIDFDYTQATYTAVYLSGFARVAKQMIQDLPYLQSALPFELLREFYLAENSKFYTDLTGVVTGSTTIPTVSNIAEALLQYIANLMNASYMPTGIVMNPKDWAEVLSTSKGTGYGVPGGITIGTDGQIRIAGVPIYAAYWVPQHKVIVGDWTRAKRVVTDDLKIEFFEQDSDNVQRNLITARIESREVLAVDRLDAFIFADVAQYS